MALLRYEIVQVFLRDHMSATGVIDVHAHVVFEELNGTAGSHGPEASVDQDGTPFFRIGGYTMKPLAYQGSVFTDLELRLSHLDRLGITLQILSPNPLTFFHGIEAHIAANFCRQHNALMANKVAEKPGRLKGLASLPMQDVDAACDELDHAIGTLGLTGAMIGTDVPQGFACASMDALYRKLVALNVPLFIHASSTNGVDGLTDQRLAAHNLSLSLGYAHEETLAVAQILMGGVFDRHPDIDICISHGGGTVAFLAEKMDQLATVDASVGEGVRDNGFLHELQKLWFDTHVKGEVAQHALRHYAHAERLVLGTNLGGFDTPDQLDPNVKELTPNTMKLLRLS